MLDDDIKLRAVEVRRHLHRFPELSNAEHETQEFILRELAAHGIAGAAKAAVTGVVVDIVGTAGPSNRKLAIRADIDALPIEESTGLPFASERAGVMHACGHDAHTAMGLAAAASLHRQRESFRGTVRFIFQPAEEAEPLGGRRIVHEGFLDDVEAAIGIHVDPYLPTGKIAVGVGSYTLASDIFDIDIKGASSHAAKPEEGVDAIAIGCAVIGEIQKIVSREVDAFSPLIISVTGFSGGGSYNILADRVMIKGTIRSGTKETRQMAHARLAHVTNGMAAVHRGGATLKITPGEPPVVNDPKLTDLVFRAGGAVVGDGNVLNMRGWTAADDFGFYSEKCPSVYFRLGVRNESKKSVFPLHHPKFTIDEDSLAIGASALRSLAVAFFSE